MKDTIKKIWKPEVLMRLIGVYMMVFGIFLIIRIINIYLPDKEYLAMVRNLIAPLLFIYSAFSLFNDRRIGWILIIFLQFFIIGFVLIRLLNITPGNYVFSEIGGSGFFFYLINIFFPVLILIFSNRKAVLIYYKINQVFRFSIILVSLLVVAYMVGFLKI